MSPSFILFGVFTQALCFSYLVVVVSLIGCLPCTGALPQACFGSSPPAAILLPVPASLSEQLPSPQSLERRSLPSQDKCPLTPSAKGSLLLY